MQMDLNENKTDYITSVLSGVLGTVPMAGSLLSEAITQIIPNQRMDRVVNFIKELAIELEKQKIDIEKLKQKIEGKYEYGAYFTNCIRYLSNDVYEEKINYYKKLCFSGLIGDEKNLIHCERVLHILSDLDFYEIQYLRYYYDPRMAPTDMMKDVFSKIGFDILFPLYNMGMNEEQIIEETYKQVTLNNLVKNGLLQKKTNSRTGIEKYEITTLGRMILKKIGYDEIRVF